jgi:sec-independent protein translocase protein TatB
MGFGELVVVVIVGLLIFGPKELPGVLRKLGQWAGKLRRMAADLRAQSGIDEALVSEGLAEPIREIQKLTRGELDGVVRSVRDAAPAFAGEAVRAYRREEAPEIDVLRDREYPTIGCDAYGALPDDAVVYRDTLPRSLLADDPLWSAGEEVPPITEAPKADVKVA